MKDKEPNPVEVPTTAVPPKKPGTFLKPAELGPEAGVQVQTEGLVQGLVAVDQIATLMGVFGLDPARLLDYPFQHQQKSHGELWRLRIEGPVSRVVAGLAQQVHPWMYVRDIPESQAPAA